MSGTFVPLLLKILNQAFSPSFASSISSCSSPRPSSNLTRITACGQLTEALAPQKNPVISTNLPLWHNKLSAALYIVDHNSNCSPLPLLNLYYLSQYSLSQRMYFLCRHSLHILLPKCTNLRNNFNQKPFHFFILIL